MFFYHKKKGKYELHKQKIARLIPKKQIYLHEIKKNKNYLG